MLACQCCLCNGGPRGETLYLNLPRPWEMVGAAVAPVKKSILLARNSLDLSRYTTMPRVGRKVTFTHCDPLQDVESQRVEIENTKTFTKQISDWFVKLYRRCFARTARPLSEPSSTTSPDM